MSTPLTTLPPLKPADVGERSAELLKLGHKHEAILNFLLANPTMPLSQVAPRFGVTQAWLSTVIHSDCFQSKLRARQDEVFNTHVMPLQEKLLGIAHTAADKLHEQVANSTDPDFILNTSDKVLNRLGFGSKNTHAPAPTTQTNIQQNIYTQTVDKDVLADAREKARLVREGIVPPALTPPIEGGEDV